ncbi:MAG TPA: metal ABC transporter ATP-binding protein [Smithellaceae bacterium]|nr:metal ABC transporter ATP-binding protein [Smithellaceae bacterium]HQF84646.1 metal ABC transporter ATP-binding protein [Smithellaceae bacterium]HQG81359.1 metal ABC transporter ATP-binding protein [Smithellaceae bacterium]
MTDQALFLKHVSVCKNKNILLADIDLLIGTNEFVGIIGPNGAGKTTLLNVIAGFEKFRGELYLFGKPQTWRRSRAERLSIGYVPQLTQIDPGFPILAGQAVMTGAVGRCGLFHKAGKDVELEAMRLMEMMRVSHLARRPLGHLSGGERQKVMLARAILQHPDVLLLDEPTANLDIAVQKEVLNLIDEIFERRSLTILFVTHDFNMLPTRLNRALLLKEGRKYFDGTVMEALSGSMLSRLFEYRLETFERGGRRFVSYD